LRRIEASGAAPDVGEDFLHGIFRIGVRARQAARDGPDETAELIDALAHCSCIASRYSDEHQIRHSAMS
jgi:hypothetical protein